MSSMLFFSLSSSPVSPPRTPIRLPHPTPLILRSHVGSHFSGRPPEAGTLALSPKLSPVGPDGHPLGLLCGGRRRRRRGIAAFVSDAESAGSFEVDEAERAARGESTMPERFRHLNREAPDPPIRWPLFVALAFLIYAWRAVLFELSNWKKAALAIVGFVGYLLKLALALIFHFIGDPITFTIRCIETAIYSVRAFYSGIVAYAPVPELTVIIMLASAVVAIGEAVVPNCVSSQPYSLTVAGLIGYAAVRGYISEPALWTLLVGLYGFSRVIKKRDNVSSVLPAAAVMAAIGEPWVRVVVIASYLALAISHHSRQLSEGKEVEEVGTNRRVPMPLFVAALAIGIRVAAKWVGHRHLTWMIV
ncbi:uncharacterized protein LOC125316706 [Rhodamnia argentea]|uniref:Uncharacterized protein LOC125316706 n=1 Tax=Rhodamnia argentea TaxID=178133 RepID=A0ABM3HYQ9_9MYRT|nr:uncharacterized protein LOC125316706 [Rhodamnia argentea]